MRALLTVLTFSLISHRAVAEPRAWSEARFESNVREVLAGEYPRAKIARFEDDAYRIDRGSDGALEIRFTKAHAECRAAWAGCEAAVPHVIAALHQAEHPADVKVAQLGIALRASGKIEEVRRRTPDIYTRPFSSDARWILVADNPDTIRLAVTPELVKRKPDEAWQTAVTASKPTNVVTAEAGPSLLYQDNYAPSALLFPELLEAAVRARHPDAKGHLLAVTPEENIGLYMIGGPAEAKDLRGAAVSGAKDSPIPLSTAVMEWRDGHWREMK